MKKSQREQNLNINKPWLKFYDEGVPTTINYPDKMLWEIILDSAEKYPDNLAYEFYGTSVTFKEFMNEIEEAACALKSIGVKENDVVTVCAPNIPQAIVSFYAINMVGAISNMIHPLSAVKEIQEYLSISKSKFVITIDLACEKIMSVLDKSFVKKVVVMSASEKMNKFTKVFYNLTQGRKIKVPYNEDIVISWKSFLELGYDYEGKCSTKKSSDSPAVILYSGGTTGKPKGVLLSNRNFNAATLQTASMIQPVLPGETILTIMPIFHAFGLDVCIHTPLSLGVKCILIPIFNYRKFGRLIKQYKPNYIVGVPTLLESMISDEKLQNSDLSFIKQIITGGDVISISLKDRVDKFLKEHGSNANARAGYGLTEGCGPSALMPFNVQPLGSIGVPCQDMLYKIVDIKTGECLPYDKEGEILISGPNVMLGYLNNEEETKKVLELDKDNRVWLHTGDIGKMNENGYVYFIQRLKRIIISSGYNLYPSFIESVILKHQEVKSCCAIGVSHPYKGQVVKVFIVLRNKNVDLDKVKSELKELCVMYLAKYSIPYFYEFRDSLPVTMLGKVDYKALEDEAK
jgi:long-chain acyl-CoA synthetase